MMNKTMQSAKKRIKNLENRKLAYSMKVSTGFDAKKNDEAVKKFFEQFKKS
jgi:hypothetical protein